MDETDESPWIAHYIKVYELGRKLLPPHAIVPKTEALWEAASAFKRNRIRVSTLCTFPAQIADLISAFTQASDQTILELTGSSIIPTPDMVIDQEAYKTKSEDNFADLFNKRLHFKVMFRGTYKGDTADSCVAAAHNLEGCWNNVVNYASDQDAIFRGVFANFFSSIFISTWTVFETLAHDLWVAALNVHPAGLAELTGRWPGPFEKQKDKKERDSRLQRALVETNPQPQSSGILAAKALRLEVLQRHNYNVSGIMGDLLADCFNFQRLEGIHDAYFKAFAGHHEIWEVMLDKDIRSICAIRNLLVHKAGYVDADFKTQVSGITRFDDAEVGKPLAIDGAMVEEIVDPFFEKCAKLITLVDEWIQTK